MKRDLQLIKKILLAIEEKYENTTLMDLKIEGYTIQQVANHAELLYGEGLISLLKGIMQEISFGHLQWAILQMRVLTILT